MIDEKIALITGCSSGLGYALAKEALDRGFHVIATARDPQDITLNHPRLHPRALDLGCEPRITEFAATIKEEFPHCDLLINNAGYGLMAPLLDLNASALQEQFQTNCIAPVTLLRATMSMLNPGATVVNIGSVSARLVTPFAGSYCASKAALHALNEAMRMELAPFGVRVLLIRAGAIKSKFGQRASRELGALARPDSRYASIAGAMRRRASLSQTRAAAPDKVAHQIIDAAESTRCPRELGVAKGNRLLALFSHLPRRIKDPLLSRQFDLHALRRDLGND
ncbi:SDR family NAD(P)-dependent oxidoreductase [Spongiibacter taiwanensis]|uniref:SDR family NAD(P)-dependent oxidoreductase n=1 Tax=Spongiibacter taiwanensis TaxID=1748242 RepID=UPI0020357F2F|nr:SDR family NAD(P)-dependent oxidoreductase [Spongiibacter taiwanensis]USA42906.1 SDR family NAD(P)-dependent oxidoreductase [Spongiibacter taiwanensis]